jgi:hypothetical protein
VLLLLRLLLLLCVSQALDLLALRLARVTLAAQGVAVGLVVVGAAAPQRDDVVHLVRRGEDRVALVAPPRLARGDDALLVPGDAPPRHPPSLDGRVHIDREKKSRGRPSTHTHTTMTTRFAPLLALSLATCVHAQTDTPVLETWEIALIAGSGSLALLMCVYSVYILRKRNAATPPPVDVEMGTKKDLTKDAPKTDAKTNAPKKDAKPNAPKEGAPTTNAPNAPKTNAPKDDVPRDVIVPGANKMPNRSHLKTYSKNANNLEQPIDGGKTGSKNVDEPGGGRKNSLRRQPPI